MKIIIINDNDTVKIDDCNEFVREFNRSLEIDGFIVVTNDNMINKIIIKAKRTMKCDDIDEHINDFDIHFKKNGFIIIDDRFSVIQVDR